MSLTARLETNAPGQGTFRIGGIETEGEILGLAVQRNLDDRYLGAQQNWQTTPHWHSLPGLQRHGSEMSVAVGHEIVDPVAAASSMALRIIIRVGGDELSAVLRVKGRLLGSPAARVLEPTEPMLVPCPEPDLELDLELPGEERETPPESPAKGRRALALGTGLLFLVLMSAAGIGAWQLGWLDDWLQPKVRQEVLAQIVAGEDASAADATLGPERETSPEAQATAPALSGGVTLPQSGALETQTLRGIELARAFLTNNPDAPAIQAEAERREQAGDCDAAMVLYNHAAQADPALASAVARRFDPQGFDARGCVEAHDATAAALWYGEAADAGDTTAQRRLGQMLIEREASGPLFEDGIRWLRLAAKAGDREAKDILAKLGKL